MIFNAYSDTTEGLFGISIKSCGHIFAEQDRQISRPNGRDDWLLFYVAKDSERMFLDRIYDVGEGGFVFFRPHEPQEHIHIGEKTGEFYYIHFNAPKDFDLFGFESFRAYSSAPSASVKDMFESVIEELQTKRYGYEKIVAAKLFELICDLSRRVAKESDPNRHYADKIAFVLQMMNKDYASEKNLDDYAKICQMSKFHFLRVFKEITGLSPVEYKNNIRMEHAKELLEDHRLTVAEIGEQVGYSSSSYFCDAFKKKNGMSPKQYRRNLK